MKIKTDFVTNSSSTSYIITNKSNYHKTIRDFVEENPDLVKYFVREYGVDKKEYNKETMLKSAEEDYSYKFKPNSSEECIFGDEDGTVLGRVFDYILREDGESESFKWRYHESRR